MFYAVTTFDADANRRQYWAGSRDGWSINPLQSQRFRTLNAARAAAYRVGVIEERVTEAEAVHPSGGMVPDYVN
jgi:hypothetical protein